MSVIGKLQAGEVTWANHESVVVNTQNGIRVIDPSFSREAALPLDTWLKFFAPDGKCQQVKSDVELSPILQAQIEETNFHKPWPAEIPRCAFSFHQRLNAVDTITDTGWSFGDNSVEVFLSAKFRAYFEHALL